MKEANCESSSIDANTESRKTSIALQALHISAKTKNLFCTFNVMGKKKMMFTMIMQAKGI
eukprot:CAMPEP_0203659276 /NCGR_PEP_ID=MMETSP0088-20131115/51419_1 /ASSEMBLY_ACC=CAM_ASM_001087 /TAXON_ID=426623 /ORGANISM="Chaetoceros affinis, Strain CCMP159" /LENGTH=59 /DNA_ID=CAMNT_0050521251 /DNA_START=760 /DNA_END=936 /DNA_ORIENTATION=+